MKPVPRDIRVPALLYLAVCVAMWPLPLLGILHVESAAAIAAVGFFVSGLSTIRLRTKGWQLWRLLKVHIFLLAIPWLLLTVSLFWRANCGYWLGMALFLAFALPSVLFGVGLGDLVSALRIRFRKSLFFLAGLLICVFSPLLTLKYFPQLYVFNHVFGGVLGPIYDEELTIRFGLFAFRGLTVLWACWFLLLAGWLRRRDDATTFAIRTRLIRYGTLTSLVIGAMYLFAPQLGIVTTYQRIETVLSESVETEHFVIHYAPESITSEQLDWIVGEHRFRYAQLSERLEVDVSELIHTYIYPNPAVRGQLIGSRTTSVTPVWLKRSQIHILADLFTAETFGHELVHVLSREFGMPFINATTAIGLVEGLAVAIEPPGGLPTSTDQVAASLQLQSDSLGALSHGLGETVAASMSPLGFWGGRGAVSYAVSGSFSSYLLDAYGADAVKVAYRTASFEDAFEKPLSKLAEEWVAHLATVEPSLAAQEWALWRFSQLSLFEQPCPHYVPPALKLVREAIEADSDGDGQRALNLYREAVEEDDTFGLAVRGWALRSFTEGANDSIDALWQLERLTFDDVQHVADTTDLGLALLLADLSKLRQGSASPHEVEIQISVLELYNDIIEQIPSFNKRARLVVEMRRDLTKDELFALLQSASPEEKAIRFDSVASGSLASTFYSAMLWESAGQPTRGLSQLESKMAGWGSLDHSVHVSLIAFRTTLADKAGDYYALLESISDLDDLGPVDSGFQRVFDDFTAKARWFLAHDE